MTSQLKVDRISPATGDKVTIDGLILEPSNRNLLINGAMNVAQRGTSFTNQPINTYNVDRWRSSGYFHNVDITQKTFTGGQTDVEGFPTHYVTVALNQTITAGQDWNFVQRIEKPQVISPGEQTFTLSFWARATSGTIPAGSFLYGLGGTKQTNPELTTTWQKITYTFTTNISSNGNYTSCVLIQHPAGSTAKSIDIALAQLEVGEVATPFEHEFFGDTLAKCQRYYETPLSPCYVGFSFGLSSAGSGAIRNYISFNTQKRAQPSMVYSEVSPAWTAQTISANTNGISVECASTVATTDARPSFKFTADAEL